MNEYLTDLNREKVLLALYKSMERMNVHIVNNNNNGVEFEVGLQRNLRNDFRELHRRSGWKVAEDEG